MFLNQFLLFRKSIIKIYSNLMYDYDFFFLIYRSLHKGTALHVYIIFISSFSTFLKKKKIKFKGQCLLSFERTILEHLFFDDYVYQMLVAATAQMVNPFCPIFDNSFEHSERKLANDKCDALLQELNRIEIVRINLELYISQQEKVGRLKC